MLDPYSELHHIKPRSLGGCDSPGNLVRLTYREHFLAHWLLTKICEGNALRRMQFALACMANLDSHSTRRPLSWQYDIARRAAVEALEASRLIAKMFPQETQKDLQLAYRRKYLERKFAQPNVVLEVNEVIATGFTNAEERVAKLSALATKWLRHFDLGPGHRRPPLGVTPFPETSDVWLARISEPPSLKLFGRVLFFNSMKGFGFIRPDDKSQDVFLSENVLRKARAVPYLDQRCAYVLAMGKRGPFAKEFIPF
jgi:cold shock CspA family protein